jgi:hypothetical protein
MATYIVSYDLVGKAETSQDYERLIDAIKLYGTYAKVLKSVWILKSNTTAAQVRDDLRQYTDGDDRLLVAALTGETAWTKILASSEWMTGNLGA